VEEQLKSILVQLGQNDEVLISDDGSTDRTLEIIESLQDKRIKLFHSKAKNPVYNFENALINATGEYIFLSDQDDIWFDNKLEKMTQLLQDHLLVFSNALIFEGTNPENGLLLYEKSNLTGFFTNFFKNKYIGATMAFKSSLLGTALPFPEKLPMHDLWLGLLAELKGKTYYIKEPLIYYRRHSENLSTTGAKSGNSLLKKLEYRILVCFYLGKRLMFS
jgi:glycosyltransferase involved in cell wall biosynthesis